MEIKKIKLENMELPKFDFMSEAMNSLYNDLNNQLETAIIEGLKRKGFEFDDKLELELFIKNRCRCEDNIDLKERVYYIDDIPFFLHKYEIKMDLNPITEDRKTIISANYGTFAYL